MLSYLGLKGRSKELIWGVRGFGFEEFKFEAERNRKPILQHPFRAGTSPSIPSQLTKSSSLRTSHQTVASQTEPTRRGPYQNSAPRRRTPRQRTGIHMLCQPHRSPYEWHRGTDVSAPSWELHCVQISVCGINNNIRREGLQTAKLN